MAGFSWFLGGMMVLMAITGISMLETGCAKSKNSASIMIEVMIAMTVAVPCFLLAGGKISGLAKTSPMMLEATLAALVCSILAGGVIGRIQVIGFMFVCLAASLLSYPLSVRACQILRSAGAYQDFGGIGTVFLTGAAAAYFASRVLGPRAGKKAGGGTSGIVPGHNIPFALAGIFLLCISLLGMAGTNGLLEDVTEKTLESAAENMVIGGSAAGLAGFLFSFIRYKKPDITMTASAVAAGFVAAIVGCNSVSLAATCLMGLAAGVFTIWGIEMLERGGKVDDPAGVVTIFGTGSFWGLVGTGIFNTQAGLKAFPGNISAILLIMAINGIIISAVEWLLGKCGLLRISAEREMEGADLCEFGLMNSYYDFQMNLDTTDWSDLYVHTRSGDEEIETVSKEPYLYEPEKAIPLTKIEIICRKEKLEALKMALNDIGIMGMTVFPVTGCGVQKGYNEYYRGVPVSIQLRAKARVEVVVAKVPVEEVVNTVRRVLYTGHIGDGKIFIYSLNDVVRVRTGESGYAAMQGALSE